MQLFSVLMKHKTDKHCNISAENKTMQTVWKYTGIEETKKTKLNKKKYLVSIHI